jgi:hypothetical protein
LPSIEQTLLSPRTNARVFILRQQLSAAVVAALRLQLCCARRSQHLCGNLSQPLGSSNTLPAQRQPQPLGLPLSEISLNALLEIRKTNWFLLRTLDSLPA